MVAVGFSPRFRVIFHLASRSDARSGGECVIHKPWMYRFKRRSATHLEAHVFQGLKPLATVTLSLRDFGIRVISKSFRRNELHSARKA